MECVGSISSSIACSTNKWHVLRGYRSIADRERFWERLLVVIISEFAHKCTCTENNISDPLKTNWEVPGDCRTNSRGWQLTERRKIDPRRRYLRRPPLILSAFFAIIREIIK